MGLIKTRRLAAMQKLQREDGIDERRFTITKIVYREGGYFGRSCAFAIDVRRNGRIIYPRNARVFRFPVYEYS